MKFYKKEGTNKFIYFFIAIFIIVLILQINRVIDKGGFFSLEQNFSFDKKPAKNTTFTFDKPQKMLVFYNGKSSQSKDILKNLEESFKFNKINYTLADIGNIVSTAGYDTFIFATDSFIGLQKSTFEAVKKATFDGKNLIFLNTSEYNPFNSISGIQKTGKVIEKSSEIHFTHKLFPGLDQHSPSSEMVVHPVFEVALNSECKILAWSKEDMKEVSQITLEDLDIEGRELFLHGGEIGIHGYNHNPLVFDGDIDFAALSYHPWRSKEDMAVGMNQLLMYVKKMFGKKIKLYVYVPPSNILKEEGKEALVKNYPDLNVIASVFYGDSERGAYASEIGRDKTIPKLFNFPRFSSGFYYDKDEMWSLFNAIAIYGYWTHFVHPDDVISDDRGMNKTWKELKQEFDKLIGEVEANHPYLEPIRASELTQRYINIEDLKIQSEKRENKIYIGMENYREPFYMTIRIRNNSIKNISSGTFKKIYDTEDSKIYLLHVENPDLIITLGEKNEQK
ncbi:DUF2194 domain-containing protein [Fusobacterium animalis]|uniref:DUF2194 domain-containing protein n=1 Tax=Fusobacterium animalis TaxID=76859 RepID=UPI0030D05FB0